MVIEFESQKWWHAPLDVRAPRDAGRPDWHALRGRLVAARDALRALQAMSAIARPGRSGSFARDAALALASLRNGLDAVNRVDSGNRKADEPSDDQAIGISKAGGRG